MKLGTDQEIAEQALAVHLAEQQLMKAKLRLRALRGETLMQPGDSMNAADLMDTIAALQNEFGGRNLRMM